jgi:3-methyl-2-oxobutanoate hydroxymethyltransferase
VQDGLSVGVSVLDVRGFKENGTRFAMLTAYDALTAQALDEAGIPILLVGDTLGVFVSGHSTTIPVTMDVMVHHCDAVTRGARNALVVGDLPFGAYQASLEDGMRNAIRLLKEGGVGAVKMEGPWFELAERLTVSGIPVMGHLGLTPQSYHQLGGNKVQGRTELAAERLLADARRLEAAGAFAIVLEAVPNEAARRVTEALTVPTIGIGAGPHCDGQVLVSSEMLGLSTGPRPRFAKTYASLREDVVRAAKAFADEVESGAYPDPAHSYDWALRS